MATSIINSTANAATSEPFNVTDVLPVVINLSGKASAIDHAMVAVELQSSSGEWMHVRTLFASRPTTTLNAAGTYRVRKPASTGAFGVDRGDIA